VEFHVIVSKNSRPIFSRFHKHILLTLLPWTYEVFVTGFKMHCQMVMLLLNCTCMIASSGVAYSWIVCNRQYQFSKADRMAISINLFQANIFCLKSWVSAESYVKLHWLSQIVSQYYKVVCVHTSGEVDSFHEHCSAFFVIDACEVCWKFVNNLQSYIKHFARFFWTRWMYIHRVP